MPVLVKRQQNHETHILDQTINQGIYIHPANYSLEWGEVEPGPRGGGLTPGCSVVILANLKYNQFQA